MEETNTKRAVEKGLNPKEFSKHILNLEIPRFNSSNTLIELRRSFFRDADFIVIEDGGTPVVIEQDDKAEWLKSICEKLFLSFGCYKPHIMWSDDLDEYFYQRVLNSNIDVLKKWQEENPKEDDEFSIGALFG